MTAICPGNGTSQTKLGVDAVVAYASGRIGQLIEETGQPELLPLVPLLFLPSIVTNHFCSSDPPAMVALTQAESDALLNLNFGPDFSSGLPKVVNIVLNQAWGDLCECSSGSATLPTPPALPPNTVVTLGPQPDPNTACATSCFLPNGPDLAACTQQHGPNAGSVGQLNVLAPAGQTPTGVTIDWNVVGGPGPSPALQIQVQYEKSGSPQITHTFNYPAGFTTIHLVDTWPDPTYTGVQTTHQYGATGGTILVEGHISVWCGGTPPGGTQQPCCPPDLATQATLDAILKMVTLIQRYHVPFAYQLGAVHSGLAQSGSFSVSGLLGLKLDVTKTANGRPVLPGTPPYQWDQGWCSVMDGNGFIQETRLSRESQVWFPKIMQDATTVGWWLEPNTQLVITEIEAEV